MTDEALNSVHSDPLKSVADVLDAAVQVARAGVVDVRSTAAQTLPALGGLFSSLTYKTCYAVSYGVVFPTMMLVRAVPKENAAVHGFVYGARAAVDLVDEMRSKSSVSEHPELPVPHHGLDTAPVTSDA